MFICWHIGTVLQPIYNKRIYVISFRPKYETGAWILGENTVHCSFENCKILKHIFLSQKFLCPALIGWKIPYSVQLEQIRFFQQLLVFTWGLQYSSSQLKTLPDSSAKFDTEILALNDWNRLSMMFWNYTIRWHCM